jgi:hypothetical protein
MAVRRFDGVDDLVFIGQPAALASGACTLAALIRPTVAKLGIICSSVQSGGPISRYGLAVLADGSLQLLVDGIDAGASPAGWVVANRWQLVALTIPTGTSVTPRFHNYGVQAGTWSRANGASTGAARAVADRFSIGYFGAFGGINFAGDIAAVGVWAQQLGDADVTRLLTDSWLAVGTPAALVVLDQKTLSAPIVERVRGETAEAISGTILDDYPPFAVIPPTVKRKVSGTWVNRELKRRDGSWRKPVTIEVAR